jgi:hypothetical protein
MRLTQLALVVMVAALGCEAASPDPGFGARLRIEDAQYVPGSPPDDEGGPELLALGVPHQQILPGLRSERVTGTLGATAEGVAIGVLGDPGYFVVSAGAPTIEEPDAPSFVAELRFARELSDAPLTLWASAVDGRGKHGARATSVLRPSVPALSAELVVRLRWDTEADLDLHVVPPVGDEIWARNVNSAKATPPGSAPADPSAYKSGGILDLDSNAGCAIDGRREENVVWTEPPPSGSYTVRVASASLCNERVAHFRVEVYRAGRRIAAASGTATPDDTRAGALRGDGRLALDFEVP